MRRETTSFDALTLLPFVALAAGVTQFVLSSPRLVLTRFPLDDAWTHQVYASALASGQGFAYNPGAQEAGFTSPLWVLVTAPLHWLAPLGTDAVVVAIKLLGVVLAGWVVWEAARLAREWAGEMGAAVAGVAMALEPRLVFSAFSGMETLLAVGLWLMAARALRHRRWGLFGAVIVLIPLARPEMLILWPLAAVAWLLLRAPEQRVRDLAKLPLAVLPLALWGLFCLAVNGHPLPNTFYAKADASLGNPFVVAGVAFYYLGQHGLLATVAGWLAVTTFLGVALRGGVTGGRPTSLFLVAGPLLYALGVVFSRDLHPSGYYWTRWVDPASLVLTLAAAVGLAMLGSAVVGGWRASRAGDGGGPWGMGAGPALAMLVLVALVVQSGSLVRSWQDHHAHLASDTRAIERLNVAAGLWLRENTPWTDGIAVNDAGAIRYFSHRGTLDLIGLNANPLALGTRTRHEMLDDWDVRWLAVFPGWFDDPEGRAMLAGFEPRVEFEIPSGEYTVCDCPTQTRLVIYERRRPDIGSSPEAAPTGESPPVFR